MFRLLSPTALMISLAAALSMSVAEPLDMMRTLRLEVENIQSESGTIWVGLYQSSGDFLDRDRAILKAVKVNRAGSIIVDIPDLTDGKEYAIALFHDLNDNGELDTNWIGLPREPWAFSGEPRTRLRLPRFEEVKFRFRSDQNEQKVKLRRW
ncbi:MAG: DUF2141 domain-containing protein [Bacteroidota bacterium]